MIRSAPLAPVSCTARARNEGLPRSGVLCRKFSGTGTAPVGVVAIRFRRGDRRLVFRQCGQGADGEQTAEE